MKRTLKHTSGFQRLIALSWVTAGLVVASQTMAVSAEETRHPSPDSERITQATPGPAPSETTAPAASSQVINPLNKAKNLARQAGERANGGLINYRAEASMHGNSADSPFVDNGNESWTFTFVGGPPGSTTPTVESVVTVFANDWRVVVDYNGPIRDRTTPSPRTQ